MTFSRVCRDGNTKVVVRRLKRAFRHEINSFFQTVLLAAPMDTVRAAAAVVRHRPDFQFADYHHLAYRAVCRAGGAEPERLQFIVHFFEAGGHRPRLMHLGGSSVKDAAWKAPVPTLRWLLTALRSEPGVDADAWRSVVAACAVVASGAAVVPHSKLTSLTSGTLAPETKGEHLAALVRCFAAFRMTVALSGASLTALLGGFHRSDVPRHTAQTLRLLLLWDSMKPFNVAWRSVLCALALRSAFTVAIRCAYGSAARRNAGRLAFYM